MLEDFYNMTNGHDPSSELDVKEVRRGRHPGDRYVRVQHTPGFQKVGRGYISVTPRATEPKTFVGKALRSVRRFLIGSPIETAREVHERLTKIKALAILGSDNISSSSYATEEIMRILLLGGISALSLTLPITLAVICVLIIVVISYQQTIRAYPHGASAYIVASNELGKLPGLTAAASLLNDYVLTVSVSIAAGVAALGSAAPFFLGSSAGEFFYDHRVLVSIVLIMIIMIGNLRGVREAGTIFAAPTYIYIISILGLLAYGFYRFASGDLPEYNPPPGWVEEWQHRSLGALSILLILRAFASGSVGLSGTEAISDGVPAFKPPEWKNARITLIFMAGTFGILFLGISFLSGQLHIIPAPEEQETVLSQLARTLVGTGPYYLLVQAATAVVLVLAANTAFSDFPRLAYFLARDGYMPHQFLHRGDRLAFSVGIISLSVIASLLLIIFGGSVTALIPLYTVGVFVAFTLSQSGMVAHWRRQRGKGWRVKAAVNGVGATITGIVAVIVAVTKFSSGVPLFNIGGFTVHAGSWIVLVLVPLMILMLMSIRSHYERAQRELQPEIPINPSDIKHTIIVPVASLNKVALQSLAYAKSISPNVTAIHVVENQEEAEEFRKEWEKFGSPCSLVIMESPYRSLVGPILAYIDAVDRKRPDDTITVVLPEFVPKHWWERLLHNQTALRLKAALLFRPGTVVINVPYHLK